METMRKIVEIIFVITIIALAYNLFLKPPPPPQVVVETVIDTLYVTTVDTVTIQSPATIDTMYIETDGDISYEIKASTQETITGNNYSIKLTVEYWYSSQVFDIETEVTVKERVIFVTNNITEYATKPKPFLRPFMGFAISKHTERYFLAVSAGVCVYERFDLYGSIDTSERIGFGLNYRF